METPSSSSPNLSSALERLRARRLALEATMRGTPTPEAPSVVPPPPPPTMVVPDVRGDVRRTLRPERAEEEALWCRFDFKTLDPRQNGYISADGVPVLEKKPDLARLRSEAARSIATKLGIQLGELRDLATDDPLKPLWIMLKSSGFLEGDFTANSDDLDLHTANALVFQRALERDDILPNGARPNYLEIAPGAVLICYLRKSIPGYDDRWHLVPTVLRRGSAFRNLHPSF